MFDLMGFSQDPQTLIQFFNAIIDPYLSVGIKSGAENVFKKCCQVYEARGRYHPTQQHFNMRSLIYNAHVSLYSNELMHSPEKTITAGISCLKNNFKSDLFDVSLFIESIISLFPHCLAIMAYRQSHYLLRVAKFWLEMGEKELNQKEIEHFTIQIELGYIKHIIDMLKNMRNRSNELEKLLENPTVDIKSFNPVEACFMFEDFDIPDGPEMLDDTIKRKIDAWLMYCRALEELEKLGDSIEAAEKRDLTFELSQIKRFFKFSDPVMSSLQVDK